MEIETCQRKEGREGSGQRGGAFNYKVIG